MLIKSHALSPVPRAVAQNAPTRGICSGHIKGRSTFGAIHRPKDFVNFLYSSERESKTLHCPPGFGPILTSSRVAGFRGAALRHVVMVSGCWVSVPPPLTVSRIIEICRSRLEFARPLDNSSHRNITQCTQKQEAILPNTIKQYTQAQSEIRIYHRQTMYI